MLKFLSKLAVVAIFVSLTGTTRSQISLAQTQPANGRSSPSPTPTATTIDLKLLNKAFGKFWQGNRAQTRSQTTMAIQVKSPQPKLVKIEVTANTIAQVGNKFRSELIISKVGNPLKFNYTIVGDGKTVWVYNPAKRQYSKHVLADFASQGYSEFISMSSGIFASIPEKDYRRVVASASNNKDIISSMSQADSQAWQGSNRSVDGQNLYVYSYASFDMKLLGLSYNGSVEPETGILKQIESVTIGNGQQQDVKVTEKILSRTTSNNNSTQDFRFSPPRGAKQVKGSTPLFVEDIKE